MGGSVSTAVANTTQSSLKKINNKVQFEQSSQANNRVYNLIKAHRGNIVINNMSNTIRQHTKFSVKMALALSDTMQESTSQLVAQQLLSQIKNLNVLQVGASVADVAATLNVALDCFTVTATKCVSMIVNDISSTNEAYNSVTINNYHNLIDTNTTTKCSTEDAIARNIQQSQLIDIQQRLKTKVDGVDPTLLIGAAVGVLFALAAPVVLPLFVTGAALKHYLPTIVLVGTGAGMLVYHRVMKYTLTAVDGPEVLANVSADAVVKLEAAGANYESLILNDYSDRFKAFRVRDDTLYGIATNDDSKGFNVKSVLKRYHQLPIIVRISDDGKYLYLFKLSRSTVPVAFIRINDNTPPIKSIGVSLYTPTGDTPPVDIHKNQSMVVLRDKQFRLYTWNVATKMWVGDEVAVTSSAPDNNTNPEYNRRVTGDEHVYTIDSSIYNDTTTGGSNQQLMRYVFIHKPQWPVYAGYTLLAGGVASLLYGIYTHKSEKDAALAS